MMKEMLETVTEKRKILEDLRPLPPQSMQNLRAWFNIELAYTSNALEGNTLTRRETALIIEQGLTVGGKKLKEYLEVINHVGAFSYIFNLAAEHRKAITLRNLLDMHSLILQVIDDNHAGTFRRIPISSIDTGVTFADPAKIPALMDEFIQWLHTLHGHPILIAAQAHVTFATIHPFIDGNGIVARLLMNLLLMQEGYPPAIIEPENRLRYIDALAQAQLTGDDEPFNRFIIEQVDRSLNIYLEYAQVSIIT